MSEFRLRLEGMTLGYGERVVLRNITLEVASGQMLGLIGPNGSGKSTLIRGITRLIALRDGRMFLDGREIRQLSREGLARIVAVVPQNAGLPELFTALEVVLMGRTPHLGRFRHESARDFAIAWQAMEATDTLGLVERRVGELSGGERQRLCLARALAQEPKVLLLDEPTAHLDINHQVETLELVRALCHNRGLAVLAALHDLNLAAQYCDRLVMIAGGGIYSQGRPGEVITAAGIREVYGVDVDIQPHPVNGLPLVTVTPDGRKVEERERLLWKM